MKNRTIKFLIGGWLVTTFIFALIFTCGFVFAAEETQETSGTITSVVDWIKSLSLDEVKGWLTALFVKLGIDAGTLIVLAIALIKSRLAKVKQDKFYLELQAKLDEEHKRQLSEAYDQFNTRLEEVQNLLINEVKNLDEKKRAEAESNIETLKTNLENIKVELEK